MSRIIRSNSKWNTGLDIVKNTRQHMSVANDCPFSHLCVSVVCVERLCYSEKLEYCSKQRWPHLRPWPRYSRQKQEE